MASPHFVILEGPGQIERLRGAFVGKASHERWGGLINVDAAEVEAAWPEVAATWSGEHVTTILQSPIAAGHSTPASPRANEYQVNNRGWTASWTADEQRPGRYGVVVEVDGTVTAVSPSPDQLDAWEGRQRVVILDASWGHVARFPEREEVRESIEDMLRNGAGRIYYVTNLPWDAELFVDTARELQYEDRARLVYVSGVGQRLLWQVREVVPRVQADDTVLMGLVAGRDDRGALQRLRSDFAERTDHVHVYPVYPLSTGAGLSREEATAAVGLWLPTQVLIAGGPISEQVLLARALEEASGGGPAIIGTTGAEYRLPSLTCARQFDLRAATPTAALARTRAAKAGLVIASYSRDEVVQLTGVGLSEAAEKVIGRLRINRRGKTPERVVHELENAFSSRGIPLPSVRFVP